MRASSQSRAGDCGAEEAELRDERSQARAWERDGTVQNSTAIFAATELADFTAGGGCVESSEERSHFHSRLLPPTIPPSPAGRGAGGEGWELGPSEYEALLRREDFSNEAEQRKKRSFGGSVPKPELGYETQTVKSSALLSASLESRPGTPDSHTRRARQSGRRDREHRSCRAAIPGTPPSRRPGLHTSA
jgi:hypothetical protein